MSLVNWFVSWFVRVLPSHNHYGRKMHLDCNACGQAFTQAVVQLLVANRVQVAPLPVEPELPSLEIAAADNAVNSVIPPKGNTRKPFKRRD